MVIWGCLVHVAPTGLMKQQNLEYALMDWLAWFYFNIWGQKTSYQWLKSLPFFFFTLTRHRMHELFYCWLWKSRKCLVSGQKMMRFGWWGARITGVLGRLGSRNCGGGQILHCWGWVSGRNKEAYLKELSPADLGTNYWRTDEIQANNFIQSFLCTRKGYRCCGGIKEGHHISCSPFCILRPAASPPWTCCSTCAYLRGARCCFGNSLSGMLG